MKAPVLVSSLTSVEICRQMRPGDSTTGVKDRPTPNCLNSIVTLPCWSLADRHGEFAAGEEFRGFARHGGEIGLGQHMHQADLFQRVEHALGIVGRSRTRCGVVTGPRDGLHRRHADRWY